VSFQTFTLPEDRCVRLLVKNLGRGMLEIDVREQLEALDIHIQAVMQLRSGRRDQDPTKDRPLSPTSLYQWHGGPRCLRYDLPPLRSASVGGVVRGYKGRLQCKSCQLFGHTQRNYGYAHRCVACGGAQLTGGCSTPRE